MLTMWERADSLPQRNNIAPLSLRSPSPPVNTNSLHCHGALSLSLLLYSLPTPTEYPERNTIMAMQFHSGFLSTITQTVCFVCRSYVSGP